VGENNTQLFSWHWPGDDELKLLIVISIVDMTVFSNVNSAFAGLPDTSQKIRELWGCVEEPNGDGGPYVRNVTPILSNNTAAGWINVAMKLSSPTHFCIVYCGEQADGTAGAPTPMCGGCSDHALDDILPPLAPDMIDDIGEESDDDDAETRRPNPRSFLTMRTGFRKLERKLHKRIIRQQL
jgi:hypothetical protein